MGLLPLLLLLFSELVCGVAGILLLLGFWFLSEEEPGEVPAALAPGSFRRVWPGVSTLPFIAWSLAAAFSAEHLFPRTSGSGGKADALFVDALLPCDP